MPNEIKSIDPCVLDAVTGGKKHGDPLLNDIGNLASQIKDLTKKTSGFDSTQMLMLVFLAAQRQNTRSNVVFVGRSRCW